ncbi:MAG: glycyl-radical enzyme activating protein [Clostridia bacterium]|nr:glycyl-radical enzyme activating protein [Clostridia bacterium]
MSKTGLISKIQHFSLGDGPGIRTTVFMQGCNLRCTWCHNPETIKAKSVLLCYETKCTLCGLCGKVCPKGAISFENGKRIVDENLCNYCGTCETLCPQDAIMMSGKEKTADEVFLEIMKDADFYPGSNGGVTFSGGEPLLQADFCAKIAKKCKEQNIHVLVDTAGCVTYANFEKILPYCDLFYFDLKASNNKEFEKACGGNFDLVTDNLKKLASVSNVIVRMPIIPGYNDNAEYIETCAKILTDTDVKRVDLLPFHRLGSSKYHALGLDYLYDNIKPPEMSEMEKLMSIMKNSGIDCRIEK